MRFLAVLLAMSGIASAQVVTTSQYGVTFSNTVTIGADAPIVFYNCSFSNAGFLMSIGNGQSVECYNCNFQGLNPNIYGAQGAIGIWATGPKHLYLYNCRFRDLRVEITVDGQWSTPDISYWACTFEHHNNRISDGHGGWLNYVAWGGGVGFMHCTGPVLQVDQNGNFYHPGTKFDVQNCSFVNMIGVDEPGDTLNVYESSGLLVNHCHFEGCKGQYESVQINDTYTAAIVTDDEWSDSGQTGQYNWTTYGCVFENNVVIDGTISIWAGHDNQFLNNTVRNSGVSTTGQPIALMGIQRLTPEGITWAQSNVVNGNIVSSTFQGQDYSYNDQAGGVNWDANTNF